MTESKTPSKSFEVIKDRVQEAADISEIAGIMTKLMQRRYPNPKKILRGVHPKSHGCVNATFLINSDIEKQLCVGLFASPGRRYDAIVRFSNAAALVEADIDAQGNHGSRGMAIKVYDVGGEVLYDDDGQKNQDFLMINQAEFAFANIKDYLRLNRILHDNNDQPDAFFSTDGLQPDEVERLQRSAQLIGKIRQIAVANPMKVSYFGAAPFLFGADRVMRFRVTPRLAEDTPPQLPDSADDNYLRNAVTETMQQDVSLEFDFAVQVRSEGDNLNIEDASQSWDDSETPFINVALLSIPAPQSDVNALPVEQICESLFYTPWHSLVAHRPLGSINRLRQAVYVASATTRRVKEFHRGQIDRFMRAFGIKL